MGFDWKPKRKKKRRRYRDYSDSDSSSSSDSDSDAPRRRRKKKKSKTKWGRIPAAEKSMMIMQAGYDPTEVDSDFSLKMSDNKMEQSRCCAQKSIEKSRRLK